MAGSLRDAFILLVGLGTDGGSAKIEAGPQRESLFYFGLVLILLGTVLLVSRSVIGILGGKET